MTNFTQNDMQSELIHTSLRFLKHYAYNIIWGVVAQWYRTLTANLVRVTQ
jgi:hypothetical protein